MTKVVNKRTHGGRFSGYGWPATLELLSPPINAADSRHSIKMVICPFRDSVHEIGGDCPASRHPIRFFIDSPANLTLLEAWTWIHNLTRNESGNVTSFPLVVTGETRTLGLDPMVLNVLPNVTVENSGNHSEPPPPVRQKTFWELAWNTFTGIVSTVWNVVVAVATFIANAALAVVKWAIGFAKAIASGQGLQYFYETVVKPFVDIILAFIRWIMDFIVMIVTSIVNLLIKPIVNSILDWGGKIVTEIGRSLSGGVSLEQFTNALAQILLASGVFFVFMAIVAALMIINTITNPFLGIWADIIAWVIRIVAVIVIAALVGLAIPELLGHDSSIPPERDFQMSASFTLSEFVFALGMSLALVTRPLETLVTFALVSLAVSLISIALLLVREVALRGNDKQTIRSRIIVDSIEVSMATEAHWSLQSPPFIKRWYKILDALDESLDWISMCWGYLDLLEDSADYVRAPG